jgi:hypothetical protein
MLCGDEQILAVLTTSLPGWRTQDRKLLLGAVAGHHGRPVMPPGIDEAWVCSGCWAAARAFVDEAAACLAPPTLRPPAPKTGAVLSWWLAGLTNLCDWIGSSVAWFTYVGDDCAALSGYWSTAQAQARVAIHDSGLLPVESAPRRFRQGWRQAARLESARVRDEIFRAVCMMESAICAALAKQLRLPVADGFMAHLDPAQSHDLAQVAQGQPVAQPAEHDEGNDVAWQRGPVQHAATALVELPAAVPAAEAAIAARRHPSPLRHRHGLTPHAVHLDPTRL